MCENFTKKLDKSYDAFVYHLKNKCKIVTKKHFLPYIPAANIRIMFDPELYNASSPLADHPSHEVIKKLKSLVPETRRHGKAIDIGCGDGHVTAKLLHDSFPKLHFTGTDVSDAMLSFAQKNYTSESVKFQKLDIGAESVDENLKNQFDFAFSFFALQMIPDQMRAFKNIYDLMAPEGICALQLVTVDVAYDIDIELAKNPKFAKYIKSSDDLISPYHKAKSPESECEKLMVEIGFKSVIVDFNNVLVYYENKALYEDHVLSYDRGYAVVPAEVKAEYAKEFKKALNRQGNDLVEFKETGEVVIKHNAIVGYGIKSNNKLLTF